MRFIARFAALPLFLVPACGTEVGVDQEFTLAPGAVATIQDAGAAIRLDSIAGDSRCPVDVVCVWAGNAKLGLAILVPGQPERPAEVNTTLEPKTAEFGTWVVELVRLDPEPRSTVAIRRDAYRATLRVRRR